MADKTLKKIDNLLNEAECKKIRLSSIKISKTAKYYAEETNFSEILKNTNDETLNCENLALMDAYQQPVIVYKSSENYLLISGVFTFSLLQLKASRDSLHNSQNELAVPAFVLQTIPSKSISKLLLLNELTRVVLRQYSGVRSSEISEVLKSWFLNECGGQSLFKNENWLSLFPVITNQRALSKWLRINTKSLQGIS